MPEIKFEKEWLDATLSQCAAELTDMLKSEQAALAKSPLDDAPADESEGSEGPASPPPSDESAGGDDAGAPPEASAPVGEASAPDDGSAPPAPEASAPAPDAAPGAEQAIEPAPTVEALMAEYAKLDPEALKMHYLACKSALAATMGADPAAGGAPEASAPGAGAPPPMAPPAGPPPGAAPMAMGEMSGKKVNLSDGNGGEVAAGKMAKAEGEIASLRKQLEAQNTALLQLAEVVATPIRKSVKGLSDLKFIERTEEVKPTASASLSKKEVQAVLREKVRTGKLSKADKELVTSYSVGAIDISKIEHLLANAK